jgi:5'(3')-deoxyribonucleotidase
MMNEWEIQCKATFKHQTDSESFTEMKLNINELQVFCHMSTRPYVKEILQNLINKLSIYIVQMNNNSANGSKIKPKWSNVVDNDKWHNQPFKIQIITSS